MNRLLIILALFVTSAIAGEDIVQRSEAVKQAMEMAIKEKKNVLVLVEKEGCGYCKKLKADIASNPAVKAKVNGKYKYVIIDESEAMDTQLEANMFPTVFIINVETHDIDDEIVGYQSPVDFLERLK